VSIPLAVLESITDASGIALRIEVLLPTGVRHRQLRVRTLILGMLLALTSRRPAFLTEAHAALIALPEPEQARPGVTEEWKHGPHQLTCRQAECTFGLVARALAKDQPDGAPSGQLASVCDDLLEASIPARHKDTSTALAADWTDVETSARPGTAAPRAPAPRHPGGTATPASPAPRARFSSATTCQPPPWPPGKTARPSRSRPAG
jgi:hypothetical protein